MLMSLLSLRCLPKWSECLVRPEAALAASHALSPQLLLRCYCDNLPVTTNNCSLNAVRLTDIGDQNDNQDTWMFLHTL